MSCVIRWLGALGFALVLVACATPTVVQSVKTSDNELDCNGLKGEIAEAEQFEAAARKERGITSTNVAAAILFFPALGATYLNTEDAINAAKERKTHLMAIAKKKSCSFLTGAAGRSVEAAQVSVASPPQARTPAPAEPTVGSSVLAEQRTAMLPQVAPMTIVEAQKRLAALGYEPGSPDGKMGSRTVGALQKFQRDRGISVTGKLDSATEGELRK